MTCARPKVTRFLPNTLDEIKRDMERRHLICEQICRIEQERVKRLELIAAVRCLLPKVRG